ncbi:lipocalin-like domain-containing protein [Stutzerimonas nosocomialis]|uniref:lipocalin-like domain-containing protein n=1 Tax=Stutzerimonas nosocomialis TaxID=1056496 RepID=UPI001F4F2E9A|nr:lipocalin-like domain-containing protein [Stutzerimonas nosocomialis]
MVQEPARGYLEHGQCNDRATRHQGRCLRARAPWLAVFTRERTFIEVLTDPRVPAFRSNVRGEGTDEENRAAMAGSIGFFGRYTVDQKGEFSGNTVEGATFPNWVGSVRTRDDLLLQVDGDRMTEHFLRPDGTQVHIVWERVR